MARPFKMSEAEDLDLNLLVNNFLARTPDYLPISGNDGTLILMPCEDTGEWSPEYGQREGVVEPDPFEKRAAKSELLM